MRPWFAIVLLLAGCAEAPTAVTPTWNEGPWRADLEHTLHVSWPRTGQQATGEGSGCAALGTGQRFEVWNLTASFVWTPVAEEARVLNATVEDDRFKDLSSAEGGSPLTLYVSYAEVPPRAHLSLFAVPSVRTGTVLLDQPVALRVEFEYRSAARPQLGPILECTL